jgi:hypothetical protein
MHDQSPDTDPAHKCKVIGSSRGYDVVDSVVEHRDRTF